jgi:non-ribosomal peptide synthetase component F
MYDKGLPKAVMLDHAALSLRMRSLWMELEFKENEKIMQAGLFGSELFQTEFLLTLSNGGCLCLLDSEHLQNPQKAAAYILDKKIETIFFKPSFLTLFLNWLESNSNYKPELEQLLRRIITCGHPVPTKMTRQWQGKIDTRIYNLFGSAETSFVAAASIRNHQAPRSRIGKPLKFSRIVLLDRFNNLPPLGAAGEICIGGPCLARCYMNSPEKNRKHFIGNPHKPGEKLYRTGQLGRWNEAGELEYLGMIEEELENKGQKIDPEDIKAALLNCEGVHAAIVQLRENKDGKKEIIAFIGGLSDETAVMDEFKQRFPPQLCPDWIVKMNHLPVTSSRRIRY